MNKHVQQKFHLYMLIGMIGLVLMAIFAISTGHFSISFTEVMKVLVGIDSDIPNVNVVVRSVRLPRILFSCIAGAGLAVAGASFQALFANPLATPDTLGTANGASFGAAFAILLGLSGFGVQISALLFGLISLLLVFLVGYKKENTNIIMLVLAGMVISALFSALVTFIKYVADPNDVLPVITFWLMGSFSSLTMKSLYIGAPMIIIATCILFLLRYRLNIISLHEDEARSLGINIHVLRTIIIICGGMITASIVSICGVIGWVGLLIPHVSRMVVGNDHSRVIPMSIVYGALFMLICDTIARTMTMSEIPVSILTAIIGAPIFILILRKTGGIRI